MVRRDSEPGKSRGRGGRTAEVEFARDAPGAAAVVVLVPPNAAGRADRGMG